MAFSSPQLRDLVTATLKEANLHSPEAVKLLLGTCAVESEFGTYIKQRGGPALSPWQIEEPTFNWLKERYKKYHPYIDKEFEALEWDLKLAILMCRLRYLVVPDPIPKTLAEQAVYWKKYYNTFQGAGTPMAYVAAYRKHIAKE